MRFLFTSIVSALILIVVLLPGSAVPEVSVVGFDKFVHIAMFFAWSLAARFDLRGKIFSVVGTLIFGLLFSVATEIMQVFIEGRTFDYFDILADAVGLVIGILAGKKILSLILRS